MGKFFKSVLTLALLIMAAAATGCGPRAYNIEVSVSPSLRDKTLEVDIIGANESLAAVLSSTSIDQYYSGNSSVRKDANPYTMEFKREAHEPKTLAKSDPIWKQWLGKGATELFIIAYLPGRFEAGGVDPRRVRLPLSAKRWDGDTIRIELKEGLIDVLTPMKKE